MRLDAIQSTLLGLVQGISLFADVQDHLRIDDGAQLQTSEASLTSVGLSLLILPPQCTGVRDQGGGVSVLEYVTTLWVRTNPKIKTAGAARWNPLTVEQAIIPVVLAYSTTPLNLNYFVIPAGLEPESDFTDAGNFSRLLRFLTPIVP